MMPLMEQKRLPVEYLADGVQGKTDVISIIKGRKTRLIYRWREGGVDHALVLVLNTPTLLADDVDASLLLEALSDAT